MNRIACILFTLVYRRWLREYPYGHWRPIKVLGWRTALCDHGLRRATVTLCFWGLR